MTKLVAGYSRRIFRLRMTLLLMVMLGTFAVWTSRTQLSRVTAQSAPSPPAVSSSVLPVPQRRCAECHSDITNTFQSVPHSRTLTRATQEDALNSFSGRSFRNPRSNVNFHYRLHDDQLLVSTPAYAREMSIAWVFGSGKHAQTPLITFTDSEGRTSAIEHSVSWYPEQQLGVTLGMEKLEESNGVLCLGVPRTPAETVNCFGCHCTHVAVEDGQILFDYILPGVGCVRCHWNTTRHVEEMDLGLSSTIERFKELTPQESVDRCGECHRRADEMGGKITSDDKTLPRFASVGLVQSACFKRQDKVLHANGKPMRLDCTNCHNPHQPTADDWRVHTSVCLECHDNTNERATDCTNAARDENCLTCHMPKVPANEYLDFTDHWIRIRDKKSDVLP